MLLVFSSLQWKVMTGTLLSRCFGLRPSVSLAPPADLCSRRLANAVVPFVLQLLLCN